MSGVPNFLEKKKWGTKFISKNLMGSEIFSHHLSRKLIWTFITKFYQNVNFFSIFIPIFTITKFYSGSQHQLPFYISPFFSIQHFLSRTPQRCRKVKIRNVIPTIFIAEIISIIHREISYLWYRIAWQLFLAVGWKWWSRAWCVKIQVYFQPWLKVSKHSHFRSTCS